MNIKQNLQEIINQAELSEQDKELWSKFIEVNNEEVVNDIYEVLKDDLGSVGFFTKNLRDKMDAFVNRDSDKLNQIVDEEVDVIKNLEV
jgi:hypothetical protein